MNWKDATKNDPKPSANKNRAKLGFSKTVLLRVIHKGTGIKKKTYKLGSLLKAPKIPNYRQWVIEGTTNHSDYEVTHFCNITKPE
jgi:hypothetical protein